MTAPTVQFRRAVRFSGTNSAQPGLHAAIRFTSEQQHGLLGKRPVPRRGGPSGVHERRRRDGLGLLPRETDPRRRQARHRANQGLGIALILFGGTVMGCSLAFVQRGEAAHGGLALLLGLVTLLQGVWLVGRQERRGRMQKGSARSRR